MTKLNIDIKDHKFRELLTYWRKIIAERLRRGQYYEDPRYGTIVLTRREFLKLLLSLGIAGAIATLGIGMFNAHWLWAQETTSPPPTPAQYNYGELNWLELTVRGTPLGRKLAFEYLFWEGVGGILHDTSGNNRNGTIYNARWIWLPNGKYALYFPGKDAIVNCNSSDLHVTTNFTAEVIVSLDEKPNTGNWVVDNWCFLAKGQELNFVYDMSKHLYFEIHTADNKYIDFYVVYNLEYGKWYHLVGIFNAPNCYLYINKVKVGSKSYPEFTSVKQGNWVWGIGADTGWAGYKTQVHKGKIALVRSWLRSITTEEEESLYNIAKIIIPYLP